jgi:hypothetical protein
MQHKEHDDMSTETSETRLKQSTRETRREPSSSTAPSQPISAPFLSDGIEQVRDSHC